MAASIQEPKAGESTNELWQIVAKLVRAVNALQNMQVSPSSLGSFKNSDGNVMLVLNTTECPDA